MERRRDPEIQSKKMNKKFSIILNIVLVVFLTNICGATFLSKYVTAIGVADVSAPEFYICSQVADELLLINKKSDNCGSFGISGEYRTFKTEDLGGVDFNYVPRAEFSVRAKVKDTSTTTPQDLILSFGYYDISDATHYLCSATVVVDNVLKDYSPAFQNCDYAPTDIKRFFYEFRKDADCLTCEYSISKCAAGFYTKIKLDK